MGQVLQMVEAEPTAISMFCKYSSGFTPSIFQQELIEDAVKDLKIWQEALIFWFGNDYRAQSVQKLIDYYLQISGGKPVFDNRWSAPAVSKNMDCDKCNNQRWIRGNLETWPCDACRPQELMAWEKQRGKR